MSKTINTRTANRITRTPAVTAFLANIRKFEPMSREEERAAFKSLKAGDESQREKIANANLLFAFSLASKYAQGDKILDFTNCAVIGMYAAMDKFDLSEGTRFLSYAVHYMCLEIRKEMTFVEPLVRPSNVSLVAPKAKKAREEFFATEMREPSEDELIDILNRVYGIDVHNKMDVVSLKVSRLSDKVDEDGADASEVGEIAVSTASTNDYEEQMDKEDMSAKVEDSLQILPVIERKILRMFFYEDMDVAEIGERLGFTGERIRQLKAKALKTLKESKKAKAIFSA